MHTGPIEKNVKYHSSVFMNIMGNTDIMELMIEQCETHKQLKERETFWQHRLKTFYLYGLNEKKEYLYEVIFPDIPFIRYTSFFLTILTFTFVSVSCGFFGVFLPLSSS